MATAPTDIPRFQIFPAIGLARVGDSLINSYMASEAPLINFVPPGGYRGLIEPANGDATTLSAHGIPNPLYEDGVPDIDLPDVPVMAARRIKRMGCRFRIYEFDSNGNVLGEITTANAQIDWRVQLVNKKAAGDEDWGLGVAPPGPLNQPPDPNFDPENFIIDSEVQNLSGAGVAPIELGGDIMRHTNQSRYVKLGNALTDNEGRLVIRGGHGVADHWTAQPGDPEGIRNPGWYDDTSDGTIEATVTIGGISEDALSARVVVGPPDYAHPCLAPVTLFDLAFDRSGGWRGSPPMTSFTDHIHPILHRTAFLEWTLFAVLGQDYGRTPKHGHGYTANHDMHPDGAFLDNRVFDTLLLDPTDPNYEVGQARREFYLQKLKHPTDASLQSDLQGASNNMPAITGLTFTPVQYKYFEDLSTGNFLSDWPAGRDPVDLGLRPFRDLTDAERPAALNRASMDFAVGGPFYPGVEVGAVAGESTSYVTVGMPQPEVDFRIADTVAPGDLTQSLAVPWQTAFNQHNYRKPNEPSADNLWPSARPVLVPAKRSGASDNMLWTRPLTQTGKNDKFEKQKMRRNQQMIDNWSKLGFIAPATFYIEVSRTLQEDPDWPI